MTPLQENFDLTRYAGLWYDVARFPKFFDKNTPWETAEYTPMEDPETGEIFIEVHNTAYNKDGTIKKEITGTAEIVDPDHPAALHVSFSNLFSFLSNPNRANYLVHKTDYENYAIVGSYDRNSLYLLARERPITRELYHKMLEYVESLGYDIEELQRDYRSVDDDFEEDSSDESGNEGCIIA